MKQPDSLGFEDGMVSEESPYGWQVLLHIHPRGGLRVTAGLPALPPVAMQRKAKGAEKGMMYIDPPPNAVRTVPTNSLLCCVSAASYQICI